MKPVQQSLLDYDVSLLNAIAHQRGLAPAANQTEAIRHLVEALLSPVETAITLDHLPPPALAALHFLLDNGGQIERARFTRQYGDIRPMGGARLQRERPWEHPASISETLWYQGLIFKAFQVTDRGSLEMIFIPTDMRPLLRPDPPAPTTPAATTFQVELAPTPNWQSGSEPRLLENFFTVLVYLQTTPVRLQANGDIPPKNRQALTPQLLPPVSPRPWPDLLDFLLHLGQRANLLTVAHGRLKPNPEPVKNWLQADAARQTWQLQTAWRADPTWNELWHIPQLSPQPTGWENSPLRARSKLLGYLEQLNASPDDWLSLAGFVAAVKQTDPDFQRPDGNYDSWYIKDIHGDLLMGFEHWDAVEGALIRHLITHILFELDAAQLGAPTAASLPDAFRLTPAGLRLLQGHPPAASPTEGFSRLRVSDQFKIRVPAQASLYDRFQLARFAELTQREASQVIYHISQASFSRALKNGVTHEQVTAFLTRATNNQVPLQVIETLRAWGTRFGAAKLEQAAILRLEHPRLAAELRRSPQIAPLLGEALGPTTILIPGEHVGQLRKLLLEMGYILP
jgi:hypothetical protein